MVCFEELHSELQRVATPCPILSIENQDHLHCLPPLLDDFNATAVSHLVFRLQEVSFLECITLINFFFAVLAMPDNRILHLFSSHFDGVAGRALLGTQAT